MFNVRIFQYFLTFYGILTWYEHLKKVTKFKRTSIIKSSYYGGAFGRREALSVPVIIMVLSLKFQRSMSVLYIIIFFYIF